MNKILVLIYIIVVTCGVLYAPQYVDLVIKFSSLIDQQLMKEISTALITKGS